MVALHKLCLEPLVARLEASHQRIDIEDTAIILLGKIDECLTSPHCVGIETLALATKA